MSGGEGVGVLSYDFPEFGKTKSLVFFSTSFNSMTTADIPLMAHHSTVKPEISLTSLA